MMTSFVYAIANFIDNINFFANMCDNRIIYITLSQNIIENAERFYLKTIISKFTKILLNITSLKIYIKLSTFSINIY